MTDSPGFSYGQETPSDHGSDFEVITFICRQMMAQMHTMKLVKVTAVHGGAGAVAKAGTVDVLPLVNQVDGNGNKQEHGTVNGIPWSRTQGGQNAVICDPQVDDIGYVVAADRDISNVKATAKQSNPGTFRKFDIADGVYAGGCLNVAPNQYLVFTADGIRLVAKSGNSVAMAAAGITLTDVTGNVVSTTSGGIALTPKAGQPVTINGNAVVTGSLLLGGNIESQTGGVYAGDIKTVGNMIAGQGTGDQVGLKTHTHTQPNDSHGDTEAPTSAPTAGT